MRFLLLFRFFQGAAAFAKLDPKTFASPQEAALHQRFHRKMSTAGFIGLFLGAIFGIVAAVAMAIHPPHAALRADDIYIIIFQLVLMPIIGILTAVSWTTAFFPTAFYLGPIGERWLKILGTENVTIGRAVSILVGVLGVGIVVFFSVCAATGHV